MTSGVAAFDFDGTLTTKDSLLPYLARVAGRARVASALAVASPTLRDGRDAYKVAVLQRTLRGRPADAARQSGRAHAAALVATQLRPNLLERVAWHREQGHEILIVSASLDVYLAEVGRLLAVDHVYCSTLVVDADGRFTGDLDGGNCRGERKAELLRTHLRTRPGAPLWAYGDSSGDDEMLALADHPHRVDRGGRLVAPPLHGTPRAGRRSASGPAGPAR